MNSFTADAHTLLDIRWSNILTQTDNVLALVLEGNDVLGLWCSWIHDLGETANLKRRIRFHHLLVRFNVPLRWH